MKKEKIQFLLKQLLNAKWMFPKRLRAEKLSSKISTDMQMLQIGREDIMIKNKMLKKIEKSDMRFKETVNNLNNTLISIGSNIQQFKGYFKIHCLSHRK